MKDEAEFSLISFVKLNDQLAAYTRIRELNINLLSNHGKAIQTN